MSHYKSNLRDLEFNLFEVFGRDQVLGPGPFDDIDGDTARDILAEVDRLATEDLAACYSTATATRRSSTRPRTPRRCPSRSTKSYQRLHGRRVLARSTCPTSSAARPPRRRLRWALAELVLGAQPRSGCTRPARRSRTSCTHRAPPTQKQLAQLMVDKRWGATMVLTEPDAGSDVGAGRTQAIQQPDGTWHIEGVKRFITSASTT